MQKKVKYSGNIFFVFFIILILFYCNLNKKNEDLPIPTELVQPGDLEYKGAFKLPDSSEINIVKSWNWGGYALTYRPAQNLLSPDDQYPGSLFGTGHAWEHQVSEISIPMPFISEEKNLNELNSGTTLQPFENIFMVKTFEIPRVGIEFLEKQKDQNSDKLYLSWGQHFQKSGDLTHGWCNTDLSSLNKKGDWFIDTPHHEYNSNDYIFSIPENWAKKYTPQKKMATGRFRDGGWSGQGPSLFAFGPWEDGNPPANGQKLSFIILLRYTSSEDFDQAIHTMNNYHHSDEWSGAAWITTAGKGAVIFVGTKGVGNCWYGNQDGPCMDCEDRGWWSDNFEGQIIFYNPSDLAKVAAGEIKSFEPQPYATLKIDSKLFHIKSTQQKYHLGAAAFDRERSLLYIFEPLADGDKPLIHIWKIHD